MKNIIYSLYLTALRIMLTLAATLVVGLSIYLASCFPHYALAASLAAYMYASVRHFMKKKEVN